MKQRPTLHLFSDRLANEKKRVEAQLAELQPGPEWDKLLQILRQLDTASQMAQPFRKASLKRG